MRRRRPCLAFLFLLGLLLSAPARADDEARLLPLLYHRDPEVRIRASARLADTGDRAWIDDLVRAWSVENYAPVVLALGKSLRELAGDPTAPGRHNWKRWLYEQVRTGRLEIAYADLGVSQARDAADRGLQPLAARLGDEHLASMVAALLPGGDRPPDLDGLRYLVANDHREEVASFLCGRWLRRLLAHSHLDGAQVGYWLTRLADDGAVHDAIQAQALRCLEARDPRVVSNALGMLARPGYTVRLHVPGAEERILALRDDPRPGIAEAAVAALTVLAPHHLEGDVTYEEAFVDLHATLGRDYPCFDLKGIDWAAVGEELLPRLSSVQTDDAFGLLCMELVARLEDSHAVLRAGTAPLPRLPFPRWTHGFACLEDDRGEPVVYHVNSGGPAAAAGVRVGMILRTVDGVPVARALAEWMRERRRYIGYSSDRYLRYHAVRFFTWQRDRGRRVAMEFATAGGALLQVLIEASEPVGYVPRLPVPIPEIGEASNVSWTRLADDIGYVHVRRMRSGLIDDLDAAVADLGDARALIVDVRGNSGGGFDARRAHRNFAPEDPEEPERPRFGGPIALLIDARCISAGEGWASWFIARERARVFGETTAGASARKHVYDLRNFKFRVRFPVKAYRGYLDRPIERLGLVPDVPLRQTAEDLREGRDTVLEAARRSLLAEGRSDR
ncbi:MAG: S41 family peptidase [Planctomycetota bacterium]|jgi:carboxyl-terminal processing protease